MRNQTISILSLLVIGGLTACQQNDITTSDSSILQSNQADIQSYATSKGLTGSMTTTGVYVASTKAGTSTVTPANGQEVEFNYSIYALTRNSSNVVVESFVDSTYMTKSSYAYLVATNAGLTEGLLRMHENEQAAVLLPSAYAFGTTGSSDGKVPPNAPVRLNVTLKKIRTEDEQINEYMTANKLTPTEVTASGLRFIRTVSNPTGIAPTTTQTLNVRYRGTLLRSQSAFDSTGTGTYGFTLGQAVLGFDEGLAKLKVGEKAIIILPSKIGYGSAGKSIIPPYAPMRFDIELVSAK